MIVNTYYIYVPFGNDWSINPILQVTQAFQASVNSALSALERTLNQKNEGPQQAAKAVVDLVKVSQSWGWM